MTATETAAPPIPRLKQRYNDELRKPVGDMVSAGEVIAMAGDTGGRTRPELYFEIRRAGKPVDPQPWFRRRSPG